VCVVWCQVCKDVTFCASARVNPVMKKTVSVSPWRTELLLRRLLNHRHLRGLFCDALSFAFTSYWCVVEVLMCCGVLCRDVVWGIIRMAHRGTGHTVVCGVFVAVLRVILGLYSQLLPVQVCLWLCVNGLTDSR
jgi:hypothetical protein